MNFDLDQRSAALGAGEFAGFTTGPAGAGADGGGGLWRAQLGTRWHQELRTRAAAAHGAAARFEVGLSGTLVHRGWRLTLTGRVDQFVPGPAGATLREVKSVLRPLPADPAELRAEHPAYFIQLATYAALLRLGLAAPAPEDPPLPAATAAELVFVEAGTGLLQAVPLDPADEAAFRAQLDRVADFLELRLRARNRLRGLRFQAAFATPRPGQERTVAELTALFERHPLVCFEAPTGFGKTGVLLEFGLGQLRTGHFDRLLYLTSKATGQLQVVQTLAAMRPPDAPGGSGPPVAVWHVRNKGEHCINAVFHCVREACPHLADPAGRWERGGLARFHRDEHHARDLEALRAAGREAGVCPYEITRTALAFHDVWIGDYNYVFAPRSQASSPASPATTPRGRCSSWTRPTTSPHGPPTPSRMPAPRPTPSGCGRNSTGSGPAPPSSRRGTTGVTSCIGCPPGTPCPPTRRTMRGTCSGRSPPRSGPPGWISRRSAPPPAPPFGQSPRCSSRSTTPRPRPGSGGAPLRDGSS
ncbi:MAG: PD-(D/E)XK nuclease family protein [Opitutaceae bacterium]